MMGRGKGDLLSPIGVTLKDKYLVVIKPAIHVSTAEAYSRVKPAQQTTTLAEILKQDISTWKDLLVNDFEASVFNVHPQIGEIKQELYKQGALYACMSGSGSSVFGIFSNEVDLRNQFPGSTYWSGKATA